MGGGGSGHAKSLSGLSIGDRVGASKGEGKGHVVKSSLSSSFIRSSVYVTTTCEGSRFPVYGSDRRASIAICSSHLDRLPVVQTERNCHLFIA